jgi:hypothetical protein
MNKHLKTLAAGAAIAAGLAAAPALYAQDYLSMPSGSMMGQDMMGQGGMMGKMGSVMSDMMNMMGMSGDMGGMTGHCNAMMQGTDGQRPTTSGGHPSPSSGVSDKDRRPAWNASGDRRSSF